jgi:hypothetical protein
MELPFKGARLDGLDGAGPWSTDHQIWGEVKRIHKRKKEKKLREQERWRGSQLSSQLERSITVVLILLKSRANFRRTITQPLTLRVVVGRDSRERFTTAPWCVHSPMSSDCLPLTSFHGLAPPPFAYMLEQCKGSKSMMPWSLTILGFKTYCLTLR